MARRAPTAVELFAGCGGMATGLSAAGFEHTGLYEIDSRCVDTLVFNGFHQARCADVATVDFSAHRGVDMVCGGTPCQPYSSAGSHLGSYDPRDGWPQAVRAVAEARPRCFLFENVGSFLRDAYSDILMDNLHSLGYHVTYHLVNCADYGLGQRRRRVFVVGFREEGDDRRFVPPPKQTTRKTLREAIADLGPPLPVGSEDMHAHRPGAKMYPPRTGSVMDAPAKTIVATARGGNNTVTDDDGVLRYITMKEAARLQGFPDTFRLPPGTSWRAGYAQIGNAAPPSVVAQFARAMITAMGR